VAVGLGMAVEVGTACPGILHELNKTIIPKAKHAMCFLFIFTPLPLSLLQNGYTCPGGRVREKTTYHRDHGVHKDF